MEKPTWNVCLVLIWGITSYNVAHGSLCILSSIDQHNSFESESIGTNSERWGNGKANKVMFHFSFLNLFSLILFFIFHFVLFHFTLHSLLHSLLTFINCRIESYNHLLF